MRSAKIAGRIAGRIARSMWVVTLAFAACSTEALPQGTPGTPDMAMMVVLPPDMPMPPGPDMAWVPAPHAPAAQIPDHGGPKLSKPALVTITWMGDPLSMDLQAFDAWLVGSKYFTGSLAEYGINPGTVDASYVVPAMAPPPMLDDKDISALLKSLIDARTIPPVTPDRLYVVYPPDGTTVTYNYGGPYSYKSCSEFQAYHAIGPATSGGSIIYAVVPRCHFQGISDTDYTTWGASDQIVDAVTDPTNKGWIGLDQDVAFLYGGEVTDLCQGQSRIEDGHTVNAIWSNAAAKLDQRACVPAPAGPGFGATAMPDTVQIAAGMAGKSTLTVWTGAPLGKQLKVDVYAYPMASITAKSGTLLADNGAQLPIDITVSPGVKSGTQMVVQVYLSAPDYYVDTSVLVLVP